MTTLPRLEDLPIPADVQTGRGWTGQMLEMAAHIGAYATLLVVDHFGGQKKYIPITAEKNPFRDVIGPRNADIISRIYGPDTYQVPTGKSALFRARRAGVLTLVRRKEMTVRDAAIILRTSETYVYQLLREGEKGGEPPAILPRRTPKVDPRQINIFDYLKG